MNKQVYDSELLLSNISEIIDNRNDKETRYNELNIKINTQSARFGIHLAIFVEPYLRFIIEGKKTVESRFSINRIAPYKKIFPGDLILLKKSSGPIVGFIFVKDVWFYQLNPSTWSDIKKNFESAIHAQDPQFWESRKHATYATLIKLGKFNPITPINFQKRDRRGWIVLKSKEKYKDLSDFI